MESEPEIKEVTRAEFLNGAWILSKEGEQTKVTKITECDITVKNAAGVHVGNLVKELMKEEAK
jgi:hypothetical protein